MAKVCMSAKLIYFQIWDFLKGRSSSSMSREFPINPLMNGKTAAAPGFFIPFDSLVPGSRRWVRLQLPLLESLCGRVSRKASAHGRGGRETQGQT